MVAHQSKRRKTAGELSAQVAADTTKYKAIDVGHAMAETVPEQVMLSIKNHYHLIDEPEFCAVMLLADDPLIKGLKRRKFYCWPYLPSPRPNQSVWLYRKADDSIKRLWILPTAGKMAKLSTVPSVRKEDQTTMAWVAAFYAGTFWEYIRYEHGITLESESEYLNSHRQELIKAGCQVPSSITTDPFDFSKIAINKVVQPVDIVSS